MTMDKIYNESWKIGDIEIKNKIVLAPMAGITNKAFLTTAKEFGFELRKSDKKATKIMFNITDKKITFDRNNSDDYSKGIKTCDLELDSNILSIKILIF